MRRSNGTLDPALNILVTEPDDLDTRLEQAATKMLF